MSLMIPGLSAALISPQPPIVLDRFDRADSTTTLGTAETGQAWTAQNGTWGVIGGKAYVVVTGAGYIATVASVPGASNVIVSCDMTFSSALNRSAFSLIGRYIDASNWLLVDLGKNVDGNSIAIWKMVAGAQTREANLTNAGFVDAQTYAVKWVLNNALLTASVDGVQKLTYTLSDADQAVFSGASRYGLRQYAAASYDDGGSRWDNFRVTRL